MSEFPRLKTGAVLQYPAEQGIAYSTHIVRFLDGSEQRCREYSAPIRRWVVRLNLLDDEELSRLEEFFEDQQGALDDFSFTNPWDGAVYPSCSLENGVAAWKLQGENRGRTELVIRENRR